MFCLFVLEELPKTILHAVLLRKKFYNFQNYPDTWSNRFAQVSNMIRPGQVPEQKRHLRFCHHKSYEMILHYILG